MGKVKQESNRDVTASWAEAFSKMRLGPGVLGKTSHVMLGFLILAIVVAARVDVKDILFVLLIGATVCFIYILIAFCYALKNPGSALLEGADLVNWQQIEMAAKSISQGNISENSEPIAIGQGRSGEND